MRHEFVPFLAAHETSIKIANMRAAKHRFESWSRPASRNCILLVAMMWFVIKKLLPKPSIKVFALRFLRHVSIQRWVLTAMLAEGWDELMFLVRMVDAEEVGVERLSYFLLLFFSRAH